MSLGTRGYRKAIAGRERVLRRVSTECERMMFHVWYGKESSAVGLVELDSLASRMRVDESCLHGLLTEAESAGLLVWSPDVDLVYAIGSFQQDPPAAHNNFKGYLNEISLHPDCRARSTCIQELGQWQGSWQPGTTFEPPSNPVQRTIEPPSNPGTVAVAVAGTVAKQEQEQNKNTITPTATATADAEPLDLPLKQAKQVRELTPAQQTAILNRKLAHEAVREWNAIIAPFNAPCIPTAQWERQTASVVAKAVAALGSVDAFGGLCEWARARSEYYSGRIYRDRNGAEHRKTWTMGEWCASYNIEKMFAKCRQDSLDLQQREPVFTYDPTRKPSVEMLPAPKATA